jgi:hypothetical protein
MTRRAAVKASAVAAASTLQAAGSEPSIFELRYFQMRNSQDGQMARTSDFVRNVHMPAVGRAGGKVEGAFSNFIAPNGPFLLLLSSFPSMAAYDGSLKKLSSDRAYEKELAALDGKGGLNYVRVETSLLRAFASMPSVVAPKAEEGKPARVFELRTYESNSPVTLKRKIGMFEEGGEIAIFKRVGITPVFFAEMIVGREMPNLTYLVCYDSLAGRDAAWARFLADPEWLKLRAKPGLSDAEIVSNISNVLLRPLAFSPVR